MWSQNIISKLQSLENQKALQLLSIKHLWIFGSRAKYTEQDTSDLDLLYELDESIDQSNFEFFAALAKIREIVWVSVDFISTKHIHPDIAQEVLSTRRALW